MTPRKPVVVVSGKIASGKTTFSRALATELGTGCVGFGDEVRAIAAARGQPFTREVLQPIGEELVRDRPKELCEAVLKRGGYLPGSGLVIEGLRHVEVLTLLRTMLTQEDIVHVHILSPEELRMERIVSRGRAGDSTPTIDSHSTEIQLSRELPEVADVTIDGEREVADMVADAAARIRSR
jgi:dephospho-CoA kinase